jgi:signal transduction histidine kinase/CheY-like chemotaxis protein
MPTGVLAACASPLPPPSGLDLDRLYLVAAVSLVLLEVLIIAALLIERQQIADRFLARKTLRDWRRRVADADRRDQIMATVAHELRNCLAPIPLGIESMRQTMVYEDDKTIWACEMIARHVTQTAWLVDDLLDLSRLTAGNIDLRLAPLDLAAVAREALHLSHHFASDGGQQVALHLRAQPIPVRGDAARLTRVIGTLVNHAVRHTDPGGRISLSCEIRATEGVVTVSHTGPGIRDRGLTGGSSSIGLTLVEHLVALHGGSLELRPFRPGGAAEVIIRLPLAPAERTPARRPTAPSPRRRRVLVVDDNVDAAQSLGRVLLLRQHQVEVVHDGQQAILAAERMSPEVVLLDLDLPDLSGLEVARRLRSGSGGRRLLLIAITGRSQEEDRLSTREAGFDHHLVKPIDLAVLDALLAAGEE